MNHGVRPTSSAFSRFSGQFKGHICGQENRAGDGLGMRLESHYSVLRNTGKREVIHSIRDEAALTLVTISQI